MEIGEAIKQGISRIINENEKEKFPIGEVNDYLISNAVSYTHLTLPTTERV